LEFALWLALGRHAQAKVSVFHALDAHWLNDSLQVHPPANFSENPLFSGPDRDLKDRERPTGLPRLEVKKWAPLCRHV
jgi:hypothetical protein